MAGIELCSVHIERWHCFPLFNSGAGYIAIGEERRFKKQAETTKISVCTDNRRRAEVEGSNHNAPPSPSGQHIQVDEHYTNVRSVLF